MYSLSRIGLGSRKLDGIEIAFLCPGAPLDTLPIEFLDSRELSEARALIESLPEEELPVDAGCEIFPATERRREAREGFFFNAFTPAFRLSR